MGSKKGKISQNIVTMRRFLNESALLGADIVAFPEMNITGYFAKPEYLDCCLNTDDPGIKKAVNLTLGSNITLIFGIAEKNGNKYHITQVIAESGNIVGVYRKHNIINDEAKIFKPGNSSPIFEKNGYKYGITICADIDLPNLYQDYANKGCDFVIECASPDLYGNKNPRNWEKGYIWWRDNCIAKIGKYAKNYKIPIMVTTQSGRNVEDDFPGGGYLFSKNGDIISETIDYKQEILIIDI